MEAFKVCPKCGYAWHSRREFLGDPSLRLIGFMADWSGSSQGTFLFNHLAPACKTSLALYVDAFLDLYDGPLYEQLKKGTADCPGHCARTEELALCSAPCRNAVARSIAQKILALLPAGRDG